MDFVLVCFLVAIYVLQIRVEASWSGIYGPINQQPLTGTGAGKSRPNIVFILTDDQDLHMRSLNYMPFVKTHLIDQGTSFRKHFCTTALCCPSRVTLWTGKAAHNTNVTDVSPPYGKSHYLVSRSNLTGIAGGYPKFVSQGLNDKYLPVWLQDAGYNTYYTGKLFNAHSVNTYNSPYAAGWTGSVSRHSSCFVIVSPSFYLRNRRISSSILSHTGT